MRWLRGGVAQIIVTGGSAGADLHADHALDHERVPVSPQRQQLVDIHQSRQQPERLLQHRPVAIDDDEQRRLHGRARHPPR